MIHPLLYSFLHHHFRHFRFARVLQALAISIPAIIRRKRGAFDHLLSTVSYSLHATNIWGRPVNITIEPATLCNIACPACETGAGVLRRKRQWMDLEDFKKIIDKIHPFTNTLMFYFMGEPFINKCAYDMIRYGKQKEIPYITACTNGDLVNPEALVNSGIDHVSFQIGGMTQQSHQKYRRGSDLGKIFDHLATTINIRNQTRTKMVVECGFILMKHNEDESDVFIRRMKEMGVDKATIIDPCVRTIDQGKEMLPTDKRHWIYDPCAFEKGHLLPKLVTKNDCPWLYYSMTIQVNGDVVPCCRDPHGEFVMGNILHQDLKSLWNNEKYKHFRSEILHNQQEMPLCRLCSAYGVSRLQ